MKELSREEFEARYGKPSQQDIDEINIAGLERDFNIAYATGIQELNLSHEDAVQFAQRIVRGRVISDKVGPQSEILASIANEPIKVDLPKAEVVAEHLQQAPIPQDRVGRRMAMRYGLPALGVVLGLYGLEAIND